LTEKLVRAGPHFPQLRVMIRNVIYIYLLLSRRR
jgi:hypothetical protein